MVDREGKRGGRSKNALKWAPLVACNVLVLVIAAIYYAVVFVEIDVNPCIMTYMYPDYYKIQGENFSRLEGKYELYLYKEGPNTRKEILPLRGVPVLFIPGNAGTYKQVRSFGAETHKLINGDYSKLVDVVTGQRYANSYDFFAVHFQEEFSVLEGNVLADQTEFVNDCIQLILKLYSSPENLAMVPGFKVPTSVVLLGHSMGGFVARAVLSLPTFSTGSVTTILTLNTPHRIAPVYLHYSTAKLYHKVNEWWVSQFKDMSTGSVTALDDVVIVSICGGHRDTLIRSELASLEGLVPPSHGISTITTSLPNAWLEADHQCILWCQQFLHAMLRSILGMVDPTSRQNTLSRFDRLKHFTSTLVSDTPQQLGIMPNAAIVSPQSTSSRLDGDDLVTLASSLPVHPFPNITQAAKQAQLQVKFDISQWLEVECDHFVLLTDSRAASRAFVQIYLFDESYSSVVDLSQSNIILPPLPPIHKPSTVPSPSFLISLSPAQLHGSKYLVITALAQEKKTNFLIAQFYNSEAATFNIETMPVFPKSFKLSGSAMLTKFVLNSHHKHLPLVASLKSSSSSTHYFLPLTYQFVNQPMIESKFTFNSVTTKVKFHQSTLEPSYVLLLADPHKEYEISFGLDWRGMIGQYSRAYMLALVGCLFAVSLFTISRQFYVWRTTDEFPHFLIALRGHFNGVGMVFVVVLPLVGSFLHSRNEPGESVLLPDPFLDQFLREHTTPYWVIPFVYMAAVAFMTIVGIVSWAIFVGVAFFDKVVALARTQPSPATSSGIFSSWALYLILTLMVFVHSTIPLALATLYLPFVTRASALILSNSLVQSQSSQTSPTSPQPAASPQQSQQFLAYYHHSLFIMFALILSLTVGSFLLWIHNLLAGVYSNVPFFDGYELITALVLILSVLSAHSMLPKKGLHLDIITFIAGIYCLEYSQLLTYRAMYSMYVVVAAFVFCHFLSLKKKSS